MKKAIVVTALACLGGVAHAANVLVVVNPSSWRIENYTGGNVVAWFTGSPCTNGQLTLASNATVQDHTRFYATVMSAKAANTKIFVQYDKDLPGCPLSSFGVPEQ